MKVRFLIVVLSLVLLVCLGGCGNIRNENGVSGSETKLEDASDNSIDVSNADTNEVDSDIDASDKSEGSVDGSKDGGSSNVSESNACESDNDVSDTEGSVDNEDDKEDSIEWNAYVVSFEDRKLASGFEFLACIGNTGKASTFNVKLMIDGISISQTTVSMEDCDEIKLRFTHTSTETESTDEVKVKHSFHITDYAEATVVISAQDDVTTDNSLTIYPREIIVPKIMYVSKYVTYKDGKVNTDRLSYLQVALRAVGYSIKEEDMYNSFEEIDELKGYNLYIFEGVTPETLPTDGAVWLIDTDFASEEIARQGELISGATEYRVKASLSESSTHPILKNVDLDREFKLEDNKIYVCAKEFRPIVEMQGFFEPVMEIDGEAVMIAGEHNGQAMIIVGFDFQKTSLPIFVSEFPMLVRNMVDFSLCQ